MMSRVGLGAVQWETSPKRAPDDNMGGGVQQPESKGNGRATPCRPDSLLDIYSEWLPVDSLAVRHLLRPPANGLLTSLRSWMVTSARGLSVLGAVRVLDAVAQAAVPWLQIGMPSYYSSDSNANAYPPIASDYVHFLLSLTSVYLHPYLGFISRFGNTYENWTNDVLGLEVRVYTVPFDSRC
jgi:hypothetical protein